MFNNIFNMGVTAPNVFCLINSYFNKDIAVLKLTRVDCSFDKMIKIGKSKLCGLVGNDFNFISVWGGGFPSTTGFFLSEANE